MSSAGLILLQDVLEIVFLAVLVEKDVDEQKALESKSFDELIGELKKSGIAVPKSGTLKALNKQRVITKHYGQLAEPLTVQNYAEAADFAVDAIVRGAIGSRCREIFVLLRKQQHTRTHRWPTRVKAFEPPTIYLDAPVFSKARQDSEVVHRIGNEFKYELTASVSGFKIPEQYDRISGYRAAATEELGADWFVGYLLVQAAA
jgi:hypothetical protein